MLQWRMYFDQLRQITDYFNHQNFKTLQSIRRVADNLLELTFDRKHYVYIDLHKGDSSILMASKPLEAVKTYQAAFDTVLVKRLFRTLIIGFELVNEDKILRLNLLSRGKYKEERISIQFEFTGKYTNAIILDSQERVLEALRHIDSRNSSRAVHVGEHLEAVPKPRFTFKKYPIEDVEQFLFSRFLKRRADELSALKGVKLAQLDKQIGKLQKSLKQLDDASKLLSKSDAAQKEADLILANLYQIKAYQTKLELVDFEGQPVTIHLDKSYPKSSLMAEERFNRAKKLRQKAKNIHIEVENLQQRISFAKRLRSLIEEAETPQSIETLMPKQKQQKRKEAPKPYELFWFDGYKLLLGRNAKANQALLKDCKANDLWFHLKDRASAHVVVVSDKQKIPETIIEKAAKLCVDFSVSDHGRFSVDYTRRKELQLQEGANVLYNNYQTIIVQR